MNEHKLVQEQDRKQRAKRILEDSLYNEAFEGTLEKLRTEWENAKGLQPEDRERIWVAIQGLKKARVYLEGVIRTGDFAEMQLAEIRKKGKANG